MKKLIVLAVALLALAPAAYAGPLSNALKLNLSAVLPDGTILAWDQGNHGFRISTDWAQTWSALKGAPRVPLFRISATVFNGQLFVAGSTAKKSAGVEKVWSTPMTPGDLPFTFTNVFTGPAKSSSYPTDLDAGNGYIYVGTYGDPATPMIYRSSDGVTFSKAAALPNCRHIHAVAPDPYDPGTVYATVGDKCERVDKTLMVSHQDGALGTWTSAIATTVDGCGTQSVQISFDANHVYLAGDDNCNTAWLYNRGAATATPMGSNEHTDLAVPECGTCAWYSNAYFGTVDPDTGEYYAGTASGSKTGTEAGLFYLRDPSSAWSVFAGPSSGLIGRVFVAHGEVWDGNQHYPE